MNEGPSVPMLVLHQAEWRPYSSAVREALTELGLDFIARQVEPWPGQRDLLRARTGDDQIPVLEAEDGRVFNGTREIFAHLREREPWRYATEHRRRHVEHAIARESDAAGQLLERFRATSELEP